jgi:hypothetical protein
LTRPSPAARATIREALTHDLQGLKTTGMRPYMADQELKFLQAWFVVVGVKS